MPEAPITYCPNVLSSLRLFMRIQLPSEVGLDGFLHDVDDVGAAHGNMVLKAVLADILHQLLQIVDLRHSDTAIHAVGIVGNGAFAQICLDIALGVVGRDAEERERAFADLGIDGAEGVDFA